MTEEKFQEIKDLQEKIEDKQRKIRNIELIMSSCGIGCKITGTPRGSFRQAPEHYFSGKNEIINLLKIDKERLLQELIELQKVFSNH